jgi:signal transduction histidine kinase
MPARLPRSDAPAHWREQVLEVALRITSGLFPLVFVVIALSRHNQPIDAYLLGLAALIAVVLALHFMPQLGYRVRAIGLLVVLQVAGMISIASSGLLPGSGMGALISVALCAILFGRTATWIVMAIMPITYLYIGYLVTSGLHQLRVEDANPLVFAHWVRVTSVIGLLSILLAFALHHIVQQVEQGYRAAVDSARELRTAYDQLGMLHRRLESTKEEERASLARELHDQMGQTLTVLKLRLQLMFRGGATPDTAQSAELIELVDGLITHVRKMSFDLRPSLLDELGLEAALTAFVEQQSRLSGLTITLDARGVTQRFAPELEHACFRVVQEAVTNTMRHAQAKNVLIRVWQDPRSLQIEIEDDGKGFSAQEAADKAKAGHLGVVGMRERARLLGGDLKIGAANDGPQAGTRVRCTLPSTLG